MKKNPSKKKKKKSGEAWHYLKKGDGMYIAEEKDENSSLDNEKIFLAFWF